MSDDERVLRSGPFKGKRIEMASTAGLEMFEDIAEDFMLNIFGFEPGHYLITDLSSLHDFTGVDDMELTPLRLVAVGPDEQAGGIRMHRKFSNQDLSLTDAVGLHVMQVHRINKCWSTDRHLGLTGASLVTDEH